MFRKKLTAFYLAKLKKLTAMQMRSKSTLSSINSFFTRKNGYTNKRYEEELRHVKSKAKAAKENGGKGGRPKKPNHNPRETQSVISGFPKKTQEKPIPDSRLQTPDSNPPNITFMQKLGVPLSLFLEYRKMREVIKRPIVEGAEFLIFTELMRLQSEGESPPMVLQQAIMTSSYSLYPVRKVKNVESFQEKRSRPSAEAIKDVFGGDDGMARPFHGALPAAD